MKRQQKRKLTGLIALLLFPVTIFYMSPYLSVLGAASGIITGSILFFLLLFVSALFLRRAHCGWTCLSCGIHDASLFYVNKKVGMKSRIIKYIIWVPWFASIAWLLARNGIRKIDPLAYTRYGFSVTEPHGYMVLYIILGLIITLALTAGRRSFCHHVCWMAPFLVLGDKAGRAMRMPSLHLEPDSAACSGCGLCTLRCPMSLPVQELVESGKMGHTDCILCGECVDSCRQKAITFRYG